jgi:hypothetical protein
VYEQQPGGYQPPPQQQPRHGGAGGAIAVTAKYHWLAFLMGLFKPEIDFNGHRVANAWGRQVIPVPPGQYHVHVHVPYLLPPRIGVADLPVNVYPGQTVELEYRAPMVAFMKGAMGAPPQKYPGMLFSVIISIVALVMVLCVCGGIVVAALNPDSSSALPALPQLLRALMRQG